MSELEGGRVPDHLSEQDSLLTSGAIGLCVGCAISLHCGRGVDLQYSMESQMEQVNSQFIHDDSYRFSGPQDGQLAEMVIHFALKPGATLSWRVGTDATLCVQDAGIWLTRIWFPYDHQLPPGRELRLRRGERVWACTDGDAAARLSLTSRLPVRPNVSRWLARLSCVLHRAARQGREDQR